MQKPSRVLVIAWDVEDQALRVGIRLALDANALLSVMVPRVKVSPFVFLAPGGAMVPEQLDREAEGNLRRILASVPGGISVTGRVQTLSGRRLREEVRKGRHDTVVVARNATPASRRARQLRKLQRDDPSTTLHVIEAAAGEVCA